MHRGILLLVGAVLGSAGCAEPALGVETIGTEVEPFEVPVDVEGRTGPRASGPVSVGVDQEHPRWFALEIAGEVDFADLTMTWDAGPSTQKMFLAFGQRIDEAGGERSEVYEHVVGESPLHLNVEGLHWSGGKYVVWAYYESDTVQTRQPFAIAGRIGGWGPASGP